MLLSRENKSSNASVKEYSFAKEIRSSFWDSMTSREEDAENLKVLERILEFIKNDY